ncbi:hypothetical protein C2869_10055 [Saccharobesus litoralis]|uniref:Putative restriction endonuclease domain-containing protein n=1 Tax=Saccharobesus litoralis TaxID=2172099 RepID=A0A2S0VRA2_9ALTE|nr:Uma2 family endonuclease [Saccharobesus litoralis]AWB66746.1 hypothetical protein C2869_10055 [Saccharobesus litoralis]
MSTAEDRTMSMSVKQYLASELERDTKHEFIDGCIYAMAGASINHERISGNIFGELRNHLKGSPCEPLASDMKVKVIDNFYYPDVLVDCNFDSTTPYYTETPVIIVEVLSRSTRRLDETKKLVEYLNIPTLQEYVLIEQDVADVTVYRKSDDWRCVHYFLGDLITFESINLTLAVEEIYYRVENQDVIEYFAVKEPENNPQS